MTGHPEVSVIIPARNVASCLPDQLAALERQRVSVPWEVVVADNGSTDETRAIVEDWRGDLPVRVIDASEVPGINHARNRGAAEAAGKLLLYCDADDIVHDGWVAAYWAAIDQWDVASGDVDTCRLNDEVVRKWHTGEKYGGGLTTMGWLHTIHGCNFAVRREAHDAIGGFDEQFVGGCDDLDYGFRVQLAGYKLGYVPDAVVSYRLRTTLRATVRQRYRYGRMRSRLYRKHRGAGMPRRSGRHVVRTWGLQLAAAPQLMRVETRGRWVLDAAFLIGLLVGASADHTLYLSE